MITKTLLEDLKEFLTFVSKKYKIYINGGIKLKGEQTESEFCNIREFQKTINNVKSKIDELEYIYILLFKPKVRSEIYYFSLDKFVLRKRIIEKKYPPEKIYVTQTKMEISQNVRKLLKHYYTNLRNTTTLDR